VIAGVGVSPHFFKSVLAKKRGLTRRLTVTTVDSLTLAPFPLIVYSP